MHGYSKIIVAISFDQWAAFFVEKPEHFVRDQTPYEAIVRLLDLFGRDKAFDIESLVWVDSTTSDVHLEFVIEYEQVQRIPKPSLN